MNLIEYLGKNLKDDAVIELLEHYDMNVIYEFDRLHENTPDSYNSSAQAAGFELRFNEEKILEVIWCHVRARDGVMPIDTSVIGVECFSSFIEAKNTAERAGIKMSQPRSGSSMEGQWLRLEKESHWIHYEFSNGHLALVTLMLPWK